MSKTMILAHITYTKWHYCSHHLLRGLWIPYIFHCTSRIILRMPWADWVVTISQLIRILHHHFLLILIRSMRLILQLYVVICTSSVLIYIFQFRWARLFQSRRCHVLHHHVPLHQLHLACSSIPTESYLLRPIGLLALKRHFSIIGLPQQMIAPILI